MWLKTSYLWALMGVKWSQGRVWISQHTVRIPWKCICSAQTRTQPGAHAQQWHWGCHSWFYLNFFKHISLYTMWDMQNMKRTLGCFKGIWILTCILPLEVITSDNSSLLSTYYVLGTVLRTVRDINLYSPIGNWRTTVGSAMSQTYVLNVGLHFLFCKRKG